MTLFNHERPPLFVVDAVEQTSLHDMPHRNTCLLVVPGSIGGIREVNGWFWGALLFGMPE
ncbi:hypothetical protein [Pseudomonas sp. Irchel s3h17]|uniref:hypothetical protein n=1 Tax=Pseudomonas sp. Irchel s3h17 TaxID=2009182 RepID=UPI00117BA959|nr:hypothetical protein [Pseudomonas sp. Irchel s3h17]